MFRANHEDYRLRLRFLVEIGCSEGRCAATLWCIGLMATKSNSASMSFPLATWIKPSRRRGWFTAFLRGDWPTSQPRAQDSEFRGFIALSAGGKRLFDTAS